VIRRWLPHSLLTLSLVVVWLLLSNSVAPGQILLGVVLAVLIPLLTAAFWPQRPRIHRPRLVLKYLATLLWDIVAANVQVARLIVAPRLHLRPRFVRLPLDLEDELAITALAGTISLTPGTVTADVAPDRKSLLIHCLHVDDEDALIASIKRRYESPLKEIFEC
jgi:multicomponent K+:H+ antiporter subunit E